MVAGLLLVVAFWALNSRAYDGYFQDDELDNISWAPNVRLGAFALDVVKPVFDSSNFPAHSETLGDDRDEGRIELIDAGAQSGELGAGWLGR